METCPECGFDYGLLGRDRLGDELVSGGREVARALTEGAADALRRRDVPERWSALEYACHVRDVLSVQHARTLAALVSTTPVFASMRREELVSERRYAESDPVVVAAEVLDAAAALAAVWADLRSDQWVREGIYNFPQVQARSIDWIARHTVHEVIHHLRDIEGSRTARG